MNRFLSIRTLAEARLELARVQVSSEGIEVMAPKALGTVIKLTGVQVGAANILKQEMLSLGGDAAVARGVVNGKTEISDLLLLGNTDKIRKLLRKLQPQSIFGLKEIREDLQKQYDILVAKPAVRELNIRGKNLTLDKVKIIGILNLTPDSFSDGGNFLDPEQARQQALKLVDEGADIIDVGGESTRPGSQAVSAEEESRRVIPVIRMISQACQVPVSIDTCKAGVAREAIAAGAGMINDISALRFDADMINVLRDNPDVPVVLMHMQGIPRNMQDKPFYHDTITEILDFLKERIDFCLNSGIELNRIIIDPGIGFGKRQEDNLLILNKLAEFHSLGVPVMVGASRKSFIGRIYPSSPRERLAGTLAAAARAVEDGIQLLRVHDVLIHKQFVLTLNSIRDQI
ncbi:MAG: dihydropteroate synthase [Candidatus Cloacimonetes bacterium]|nr:dihydropteroate synthase [Candidatus Cloacimonadota bacterium]